ncbi:hypothetical protein LEMLEM_LOCUS10264, partial [Lemmus lemmus]
MLRNDFLLLGWPRFYNYLDHTQTLTDDIILSQDQKIGCSCQHLGGQDRIVQDQSHSGLLSNLQANLCYIGALCLQQ